MIERAEEGYSVCTQLGTEGRSEYRVTAVAGLIEDMGRRRVKPGEESKRWRGQ